MSWKFTEHKYVSMKFIYLGDEKENNEIEMSTCSTFFIICDLYYGSFCVNLSVIKKSDYLWFIKPFS